ncbi:MAG: hypothetical protein M3270_10790 [Thermoproteota archaeon]|nr:hypothetical protein [Thermoproteota archaeon]
MRIESEKLSESVMKWFDEEVGDGDNGMVIYTPICNHFIRFTQSMLKSN